MWFAYISDCNNLLLSTRRRYIFIRMAASTRPIAKILVLQDQMKIISIHFWHGIHIDCLLDSIKSFNSIYSSIFCLLLVCSTKALEKNQTIYLWANGQKSLGWLFGRLVARGFKCCWIYFCEKQCQRPIINMHCIDCSEMECKTQIAFLVQWLSVNNSFAM